MAQSICILGRQPAIGLAELESIFGHESIKPLAEHAAIVDIEPAHFPLDGMGSIIKVCKPLVVIPSTNWLEIHKYLKEALPRHLDYVPEGKIQLGISTYGLNVSVSKINSTALDLKKTIQSAGRSVRVVPNKAPQLNTAQVLHNRLTGNTGLELVIIADKKQVLICQTRKVQDINAYAERDQKRPKRDARVGMLPPKLAQIIINLAAVPKNGTVLDPFCGTGVILQEALLMGFKAIGADIDQRMVDFTRENVIEWLTSKFPEVFGKAGVEKGDATSMTWGDYPKYDFDGIAAETYLGKPLSSEPKAETLNKIISDVDMIHQKFLQNVARQTKAGFRMCIAVPAWKTKGDFVHLPSLDHLEELGYTRLSFVHAQNDQLVYHRPNQIVARELVTLIRK